jgi:amidophosphoribosyltransferase
MNAEAQSLDRADVLSVVPVDSILYQGGKERPLGEECGMVAVYSREGNATELARVGIARLQHRGQEACGESIYTPDGHIRTHVELGLVSAVLTKSALDELGLSKHAITHVRYTTSDKGNRANAQPIPVSYGEYSLSFGHNGNLFNTDWDSEIDLQINTPGTSDSNKLAAYILWYRLQTESWEEAVQRSLARVQKSGAISAVMLTNDGDIFGMRDPYAIRPLCIAELDDGWMIASESIAPKKAEGRYMRTFKPGEIIHITKDGELRISYYGKPSQLRECTLEKIYFSRPDSMSETVRMRQGRQRAGELLGQRMKEQGIRPTVVVPVYDSGAPASKGLAAELDLPIVDAITTDHYIGRTFIMPGQEGRQVAVNGKHNVEPEEIQGEDVVTGDDSLVRGNTARPLLKALEQAGARSKRLAVTAPPVTDRCDLGVDMNQLGELAASQYRGLPLEEIEQKVAQFIGADSMTYLPIKDVARAFETSPEFLCYHCFGGLHPIRDRQEVLFRYKERPIQGLPKVSIFISGNGTNLEKIIGDVETGDLSMEVVGVVSNKANAYGLIRAAKHNIHGIVESSKGKLNDLQMRAEYMHRLVETVDEMRPDVIVLAGWMVVLDDEFLYKMQEREIVVINLHPALLSQGNDETVRTSRGKIPVLRGTHVIEDAFNQNLPVSGITVHQLLPGNAFDTGPIVLKEEAHRIEGETRENWEKRMHAIEYRVLPAALKRVAHVLQHNIDVSKGDFPW